MCLSKGITGGFVPFGATLATETIFESFRSPDRKRTLFHGHSYAGNPIACAAGLASLALLDGKCDERRRGIERAHRAAADRFAAIPGITNVRVLGTVIALDLVARDGGDLSEVGPRLHRYALDRGVLLRPLGNTVYLLPPYCVTDEDLGRAYDVIADFVDAQ
jgi:adenosylmethionine-8-amino-7-oxononanoate aminotransferase